MEKTSSFLREGFSIAILVFFISGVFGQQNIIINGDLETDGPFFWHPMNANDGNSVLTWTTQESYQDFRSLEIFKPDLSSAAVGWISENNAQVYWNHMTDDITYNLWGNIKTSGVNTNPSTDDERIGLLFKFFDSGKALIVEEFLPADQSIASQDWHEVSGSVYIPSGSVPDSVICIVQFGNDATGTAWFDIMDLVSDPWTGMIFGDEAETPQGWMYWKASGLVKYDDSEAHSGIYSAKLEENDSDDDEIVFYSIPVTVVPDKYYHISAWIKTQGVNTDQSFTPTGILTDRLDERMGICFFFHQPPIETSWNLVDPPFDLFFYIDQTVASHDWRKYEVIMKAPAEAGGVSMRARFTSYPTGTAWYDDFSIHEVLNDSIIVIFPNGSETLLAGTAYDIAWTSIESISDVKIEYSTNGGTDWTTISVSTLNDGAFTWNIPNTPSSNCLIRITDSDGTTSDVSNGEFSIEPESQHFTWRETEDYYPIVVNSVTLDGQPIEIGDEVGVFFRDDNSDLVCGGGIIWDDTGLKAWEDDSQTPEKDGFESGEELVYRLWDASAQEEYGFLSNITYSVGDGQWGTGTYAQVDLAFITTRTLSIDLNQNWNWISSNNYPPDPDMEVVWSGVADLEIVKGYDGFYIPGVINDIGDWDIKQMYTAYLTTASTLEIEGEPADPELPIELQENWNWVSYLPDNNIDAETALASIVDYLNIAKSYEGFYIPGVINDIGDMVPAKGYKMHTTQACTLIYPTGSAKAGAAVLAKTAEVESETCRHFVDYQLTEDYHPLIVQEIKGIEGEIESGDELGIYSESGLCVGAAVLQERYPQGLMAWMDDSRTDIIDGGEPGEKMELRLWKASTDTEYRVEMEVLTGSEYIGKSSFTKVSLEVDFKSAISSVPTSYALDQNYPNPFNPLTTIRYSIVDPGKVSLVIYDINGQLIKRLENGYKDTGYYKVVWDGNNEMGNKVASGIYIYKLDANQFTAVRKMVLLK